MDRGLIADRQTRGAISASGRSRPIDLLAALVLPVASFVIYASVGGADFVSLDDPGYVAQNDRVRAGISPENVAWAFTTFHYANWHPLTWLSYMADASLAGADPGWMHRVNVALHALNAVILYALIRLATGAPWQSFAVALLFVVHPVHVETVAWISERKGLISTMFGWSSLLAYVLYARRGSRRAYIASLALLGLGLMAKPMLITWPFLMLLLDYWPLARWERSTRGRLPTAPICEKLPFLAIALVSGLITLFAQSSAGAVADFAQLGAIDRIANAALGYMSYLGRGLVPVDLAPLYPHPLDSYSGAGAAVSCLALLFLTYVFVWKLRHERALGVGWLWYVGTAVPVIGLIQVGSQATADRYAYVPFVGVYIGLVWAAAWLLRVWPHTRHILISVGAVAVIILAGLAFDQSGRWASSRELFSHTLDVTERNAAAHIHYANALQQDGELQEAIRQLEAALAISPAHPWARVSLATALVRSGRAAEARPLLVSALAERPDWGEALVEMANLELALGRPRDAVPFARRALLQSPPMPEAHVALGVALARSGELRSAIEHFQAALRIRPGDAAALHNLRLARDLLSP